jgi:hypothetical protein
MFDMKNLRKIEYFDDRSPNHGTNTQLSPSPSPRRLEENICKQCATDATVFATRPLNFCHIILHIYVSPLISLKKLWKLSITPHTIPSQNQRESFQNIRAPTLPQISKSSPPGGGSNSPPW